jgi:RecJ-like exonuclease
MTTIDIPCPHCDGHGTIEVCETCKEILDNCDCD